MDIYSSLKKIGRRLVEEMNLFQKTSDNLKCFFFFFESGSVNELEKYEPQINSFKSEIRSENGELAETRIHHARTSPRIKKMVKNKEVKATP